MSDVKVANGSDRYISFDMAKLVCSIFVVMIHVAPFGQQPSDPVFLYLNFIFCQCLCRIAVPLFFVFNGFFLYKKIALHSSVLVPTKNYLLKILKLYLLWSLIYFPLNLPTIIDNPKGVLYGFLMYLKSFVFVGSYKHLWYMNALVLAVAVIACLLYKKCSLEKIFCISLVFYALGLLGDGYYGIITPLFSVPILGRLINAYFRVFETTRNGLFFAFFFVSLGMMLSKKEILISKKKSVFFLVMSASMLFLETNLISHFGIAKDMNILVFIVPTVLFCFICLKAVKLKNFIANTYIRKANTLIYYGHMWSLAIVSALLNAFRMQLENTPWLFIMVLVVTMLFSLVVIKLSCKKQFNWLKTMY